MSERFPRHAVDSIFARFADELDRQMRSAVPKGASALHDMVAYHLGWLDEKFKPASAKTGKRLRPTLCLLCCEAVGGEWPRALPAATALELLHNFSLVHDDVQDRSPLRRNRPTVWSLWGDAQAINVGDALYAISHIAVLRSIERGMDPALVVSAAQSLNRAALALCNGQCLDLAFESRALVTMSEYLEMVGGKTAALLGCAAEIGALAGSGKAEVATSYGQFGHSLGVAFQMQDDVLGIWGDPAVTGKPVADDVRSQKKSLPVVLALESVSGGDGARLRDLYNLEAFDEGHIAEIVAILDRNGIRERSDALANEWYERSLQLLRAAQPLPRLAEDLAAVAGYLTARSF